MSFEQMGVLNIVVPHTRTSLPTICSDVVHATVPLLAIKYLVAFRKVAHKT